MNKIDKLKERLDRQKEDCLEYFEQAKNEVLKMIESGNYETINELGSYVAYNNMIKYADELKEIDVKLRVIKHITG